MRELQALYREGLQAQLEVLRLARHHFRSGDVAAEESVRRIAHSLKGSGTSYGYPAISRAADELEACAPAELDLKLVSLLSLLQKMAEEATTEAPTGILVIEDDPLVARLLELKLASPTRRVRTAPTLADAQAELRAAKVSLILLDLFLPDADGRSLLVELRARPETASLPIVVMTASTSPLTKSECFALGADAFLEKPFDPDQVAALVGSLLRRTEHSRVVETGTLTGLVARTAAVDQFWRVKRDGAIVAAATLVPEVHGRPLLKPDPDAVTDMVVSELAASIGQSGLMTKWSNGELVIMVPGATVGELADKLEKLRLHLRNNGDFAGAIVSFAAVVVDARDRASLSDAHAATQRLLGVAKGKGGDRVLIAEPLAHPRKVVLAEDDALTAALVIHRLNGDGYEVVHVPDGDSALEAALDTAVGLAILDVRMPRSNGFETLAKIKAARPDLPVVMLTGMGSERDVVRGFQLGADDYILKPFSPTELSARLQRLLDR